VPHPDSVPTPLARLDEFRDEVAKACLVQTVERTALDQIAGLPIQLAAAELPSLVSDLVKVLASGVTPGATERADWLDRLDELRGPGAGKQPLARDLAVLQTALLAVLEQHGTDLGGGDMIVTANRIATLFGELQVDAAERTARGAGGATAEDILIGADRLTGLRAQGFGEAHLRHLVSMHRRYGQPFSLLLVDIDGLKRINDAYGSAAGDKTLVGVAGAVERVVRGVDTAVRMDEDEFCVLLPNQTASRAQVAAERLVAAIEAIEDPAGHPMQITIGLVACPQHGSAADELLELADGALYRAKAAGERIAVGGPEVPVLPPEEPTE
jgi:diguanylate cyclase (GGDEF)-like protein